MRILVVGAGGMLGRDLCELLTSCRHDVLACGRRDGLIPLDAAESDQVRKAISHYKPDAVINCAAWTDVDGAERDPDGAYRGNVLTAWNLAAAVAEAGVWLLHVSTDFVFDGEAQTPYTEFDTLRPISVYGASKRAAEQVVRDVLPNRSMVVRTSWLYGVHGKSFPATILRLAQKLPEVPVVSDEFGCPTHTCSLARKLCDLVESPMAGIYHVCDDGVCSRYEMAVATVAFAGLTTPVVPITAAEYTERFRPSARRPRYSALRRLSLALRGMDDMRPWQDELQEFVAKRSWVVTE